MSILIGAVAYWIIMVAFDAIMYYGFGLESLNPFDAVFLLNDKKNMANFIGTLFFEPFEFESMKMYLEEKSAVVHKCRSKLVKKFGMWYFQKMTDDEW